MLFVMRKSTCQINYQRVACRVLEIPSQQVFQTSGYVSRAVTKLTWVGVFLEIQQFL